MNDAISRYNFIQNIQLSLIERFLKVAAHSCFMKGNRHCFLPAVALP